ncbi:MAG: PfkB family carbohydrate kinase [Bacillota bacterium]|nr:PfkB family carbohydrate kinase [Bacillota bacterium]
MQNLPTVPRALIIGLSLAIDRLLDLAALEPGRSNRYHSRSVSWGGKGLNVARGFTARGGRCTLLTLDPGGCLSRPPSDLPQLDWPPAASGSRLEALEADFPLRQNLKLHVPQADGRLELTELNDAGRAPADAGRLVEELSNYVALLTRSPEERPRVVVCSGSLPAGLPDRLYAELLASAAGSGALTILDARSRPAALALERGRVHIVKPNREELAQFTERDCSDTGKALQAARLLADRSGAWVLASLDVAGAALVLPGAAEAFYASAPGPGAMPGLGAPRRLIGAGDAMTAGLALQAQLASAAGGAVDGAALRERLDPAQLLADALAAAAVTIALPPERDPDPGQIAALRAVIPVERRRIQRDCPS